MCGWLRRAAVSASRTKRALLALLAVSSGRSTLTAMARESLRSVARNTTAKPPSPSWSSTAKASPGAARAGLAAGPGAAKGARIRVTPVGDTVLVIRLGPVRLPAHADHMDIDQLALQTWRMPAGGWLRGYRVDMVDKNGDSLPHVLLHHAELVDLERRDLLRPALNRVVSAGKETAQLMLPPGMGYPVRAGQELGINA